ncbi:helical backbone metal receptor [candidate division WOR-3 bacterium]|nr:helical backbone metal receptor [candidate division WOR-3 bacterium]
MKSKILILILFPLSLLGDIRVISLVPSVTEIIYAIGGEERLVGVVDPEGYPDVDKPIVGRFSSPNIEKIYALSPDIVFLEIDAQRRFHGIITSLGMEVREIAPQSIEEIFAGIIEVGKIVGREREAKILTDSLKRELDEIRAQRDKKRKTVFLELWENPLITIGKSSFINQMIEEAGGINITADIETAYPVLSAELVVERNPDIIIITHKGTTHPTERIGWEGVTAVKNGNIVEDLDINLLVRPGPRVIEGIKSLRKAIEDSY